MLPSEEKEIWARAFMEVLSDRKWHPHDVIVRAVQRADAVLALRKANDDVTAA